MNEKKISTSTIAMIALMTAVTCILGPLSVPIGPVPISLTNLAIYFTVILLGWKKGTVSYVAEMTFQAALMAGVIPFIIGDIAKMIVAIIVAPMIKNPLVKAGYIK